MTEESSDEESGSMKLHHLEWQSDELEELKQVLDDCINEKEVCAGRFSAKPRIEGVPTSLPIPRNAVQWAVKSTLRQESDRTEHAVVAVYFGSI
ncbi:uncharacterized protein [Dysidea avara]|uniref:uncharacterized protein isoform X2 n=1 Tax=Dysidea avara TaxID=196820 RepID=UPI003331EDC1